MQETVFSRNIRTRQADANAVLGPSGVGPILAGTGWKFQTTSDNAAFVRLKPPGVQEAIRSKTHVVKYMRSHFDSWLEFANSTNSWGIGLRPEDLIFVCGTLKTTEWAVAAFQGDTVRDQEGFVSGQLGSLGSAGFSLRLSDHVFPRAHYRFGPHPPTTTAGEEDRLLDSGDDSPTTISPNRNQCLFIHYYKMKRRLLCDLPVRAAAGPHQLPHGPHNGGQDDLMTEWDPSTYEFESEPAHDEVRTPTYIANDGC